MTTDAFSMDASSTDAFSTDAGAYVLGALSEEERAVFETHLAGCPACRADVAEVAALPNLLDRVPRDLVEHLGLGPQDVRSGAPVPGAATSLAPAGWWGTGRVDAPPGLLLDLLRVVRREERAATRRRAVVGVLAAAAVAVVTLVLSGTPFPGRSPAEPTPPSASAQTVEMVALGDVPVEATVTLEAVAWGTVIDLSCRYDAPSTGQGAGGYRDGDLPTYSLVVQDAAGATEQVATWSAVPGKDLTVPASTVILLEDIVLVEMRAQDGTALLRATT